MADGRHPARRAIFLCQARPIIAPARFPFSSRFWFYSNGKRAGINFPSAPDHQHACVPTSCTTSCCHTRAERRVNGDPMRESYCVRSIGVFGHPIVRPACAGTRAGFTLNNAYGTLRCMSRCSGDDPSGVMLCAKVDELVESSIGSITLNTTSPPSYFPSRNGPCCGVW